METIAALEIVVGFPVRAEVSAARGGTLRIETGGTTFGVHLETGERIPAREHAPPHDPILTLHTTAFSSASGAQIGYDADLVRRFSLWGTKDAPLPLSVEVGAIIAGDDDRVITCSARQISVLDRTANTVRSIAVPPVIDLGDRVTGGAQGYMDRSPIYVDPGFVVFSRSPALLVVALADLERALVFDEVRWAIQVVLATREVELRATASRGKWNPKTVTCQTGVLNVNCAIDPVSVRDRMWPPNGWATVELADGTAVPALRPPPEHYSHVASVTTQPLAFVVPPPDSWSLDVPATPEPPAGLEALVAAPRQATLAAALDYAANAKLPRARLEMLAGDQAPRAIAEWIDREVVQNDDVLTPMAAFAVPAIAAIALDPLTRQREAVAHALSRIAGAARRHSHAGVLHALRRCLPLLGNLQRARSNLKSSIAHVIAVIAYEEQRPPWFLTAASKIPELEPFLDDDDGYELDDVYD